ncbi:rap guanine nucleotide exchange factor 1b isoform X1 [Pundamilia nyererei]|uniref:CRK SH3-binding GNRP n=1 Tax=Pundamilia nyererei TaxID=303518 RepID=A0A9Y3QMP5_9CICH|nr:PREDICTED: rap guanine nucleotide exchange factor 1 isoform X1 [Pundamilia nyererei]XP_039909464.1 rap guanine nucleotide exchange factor 1b isoform X1 [Simochromis diagramma]XP_042074704.1 rap guanine nucleotide exchange factor 1b isoform X1 [Haplochromis burtoni]
MGNISWRSQASSEDTDSSLQGDLDEDTDSQRSHLSTITMILKDKFHSPKIKRTPSKKGKQLQPETAAKSTEKPTNKKVSRLEEQEKEVVSALRYFKTIVDKMVVEKKVLEMLPGSASKVLEAILPLVQVEARIQHSSALSSCHSRVYQSLANLIRWADQVMLDGIDLDDKENVASVTNVIKAVLDGVKELVKLTIEKQEQPSPTTPNKPAAPAVTAESSVSAEMPLIDREQEVSSKPAPAAAPVEAAPEVPDVEVAPPKPPLPEAKMAELRAQLSAEAGQRRPSQKENPPPALPPKKRQSAPSPTPVAVVAPMSRGSSLPCSDHRQEYEQEFLQRRFSGGSHSYGGDSPRLSPCSSMGKLSKSDEQLSSIEQDSGQCSRNTSCETLDNTDHYDPDYDFLHQDLSAGENLPPIPVGGCLSPLPESHSESSSPVPGQHPSHPRFSAPPPQHQDYWTPQPNQSSRISAPPALPMKKRRSTQTSSFSDSGSRVLYERFPSQYDNLSEEELHPTPPFPLFTPISPMPQTNGGVFVSQYVASENADVPASPPPLPEKKSKHILQYMQFVEDYSEPQPSVFYQMPQSESIYEQRNKRFQEVYGFNDSFSSTDSVHEPVQPPALPPKQRQLASHSSSPSSSSSSSLSCHLQPSVAAMEEAGSGLGLSISVSNSYLIGQASMTTPTSLDQVALTNATILDGSGGGPNGSLAGSVGSMAVCLPSESSLTDSLHTSASESANDEGGEGEYVNLYSSSQANGELPHSLGDTIAADDVLQDPTPQMPSTNNKEDKERRQKATDSAGSDEEDVDELALIDHKEIMSRITLKQENDDGPDVRAGSGDILLVHATETDRKDLVLYCEAFLTTYRTFITPEDLIKKLHYRYTTFCHSPDTFKKRVSKNTFFVLVRVVDELCLVELTEDILKQLMDLVFTLVCNGELSLARVLRKNILDKVEQKKLLRYTNSLKPLAARGVSARPGTLHDFRSHEIADQLTLLDAELFYKIEIPEVLLWAKEQNEEKSPNLTQFTEHFNNMSYWVRSLIIQQEKAQDREKLLLKFIKIMKHLRKLNNFNSYLAILSALDSAPIRRLEWQKQTSEGLEEYCTLIDSSSSFRAYRAALAEVEPPCIPYLGLILQDLTFVHLGNPDLIDGKVNFSKRWQQFNILDSMRRFQQVHYELKRNEDIVSFFNDFSDHLAEEALWELSLKIKPRNISRRKTDREEKT